MGQGSPWRRFAVRRSRRGHHLARVPVRQRQIRARNCREQARRSPPQGDCAACCQGCDAIQPGTASSSHLPPIVGSILVKPVTLPPGRGKLATKPLPTGPETVAKTMGMLILRPLSGALRKSANDRQEPGHDATHTRHGRSATISGAHHIRRTPLSSEYVLACPHPGHRTTKTRCPPSYTGAIIVLILHLTHSGGGGNWNDGMLNGSLFSGGSAAGALSHRRLAQSRCR